jgi:hypothetical protein
MLSLITLVLAAMFFAGIKTKDGEMITVGFIGGCLCFGLLYLGWSQYGARLVEAADEFFATREEVYKCQEHQDLKCQYKIMKWQTDSTDWTERVQKVIRKK